MKCPNCGYEPPPKPYEYTGYMKDYLPQILKLLRMGQTPREVSVTMRQLHQAHFFIGTITYIRKRYGIASKAGPSAADYETRNQEIAEKYLAGNTTLKKLGDEYGISRERVRGIVARFERRAARRGHETSDHIKDIPLDRLEVGVRVFNCLKNEGCKTVGDALKLSDAELLRVPNFGRTSLRELRHCLELLQRDFEGRERAVEVRS